ncbi:MAG: hypothetical protein ACREMU_02890 [Gemmatimonadaceae bacterium]
MVQRKQIIRSAITGLVIGTMSISAAGSAHSQTGGPRNSATAKPKADTTARRDPSTIPQIPAGVGSASAESNLVETLAFQNEMMSVQQKAASGDPTATARLSQWMEIMRRYEPSMLEATQRASLGDQNAAKRMGDIQFRMIHEWMGGSGSGTSGKPSP